MTFGQKKIVGLAGALTVTLALFATPSQAVPEAFAYAPSVQPQKVLSATPAAILEASVRHELIAPIPHAAPYPRLNRDIKPTPKDPGFGVFGSVAIAAGGMATVNDWRKVRNVDYTGLYGRDCSFGNKACNSRTGKAFRTIASTASAMGGVAALKYINRSVNRAITYRDDSVGWGRSDYWANPAEITQRGFGDCEDYAIAKMWMLRSLGFDERDLQLVVLKNTRSGIYHAILAVHLNGQRYVLDNMTNNVGTDDLFVSYVPMVSFAAEKSYIHGFRNKRTQVATNNDIAPASDRKKRR